MKAGSVEVRSWFGRVGASVGGYYSPLLPAQKAYVNTALCGAIYLILKPLDWEIGQGVFDLMLLFWAMALMSDLLAFYGRLSESSIGKLLLVVVVGVGANMAFAMSAQLVNELVGVDPGKFVHTTAFVSVFMAVVLVHLSLSVIFVLGTVLSVPFLMFHWLADERFTSMLFPWSRAEASVPHKRFTITVRVVSFLVLCWLAYSWAADSQNGYRAFVEDKARWFLYTLEMYKKAPCVLRDGQRVAFLDDGRLLVASEEGGTITFQIQQCVAVE